MRRQLRSDEDGSFWAIRGKKTLPYWLSWGKRQFINNPQPLQFIKPNGLFGPVVNKRGMKPNGLFGPMVIKRGMKPNGLFSVANNKRYLGPHNLFVGARKRFVEPATLPGEGEYPWVLGHTQHQDQEDQETDLQTTMDQEGK